MKKAKPTKRLNCCRGFFLTKFNVFSWQRDWQHLLLLLCCSAAAATVVPPTSHTSISQVSGSPLLSFDPLYPALPAAAIPTIIPNVVLKIALVVHTATTNQEHQNGCATSHLPKKQYYFPILSRAQATKLFWGFAPSSCSFRGVAQQFARKTQPKVHRHLVFALNLDWAGFTLFSGGHAASFRLHTDR